MNYCQSFQSRLIVLIKCGQSEVEWFIVLFESLQLIIPDMGRNYVLAHHYSLIRIAESVRYITSVSPSSSVPIVTYYLYNRHFRL